MTYSTCALKTQIMYSPQHFFLTKGSLLLTLLHIQSEFCHCRWEMNKLSHCCYHLHVPFFKSLICAVEGKLDWDVR